MKHQIKNKKIAGFVYLSIVVLLIVGFYLLKQNFYNLKNANSAVSTIGSTSSPKAVYFSALDGMQASSTENINPNVVGIMIDNYPEARPQSGLAAANIVYEAPAEGGIARYFAIFDSAQNIAKVGPVRSARPYFIDWIEEYNGLYVHCGGSPEALNRLKNGVVFDLNEMTNGSYFWRDQNKNAPHNLYTSSEQWNKVMATRPNKVKIFNQGWKFGDLATSSIEVVKNISISYSPDYMVDWSYDNNQQKYHRYVNGVILKEDEQNLVADSIVIQYVKSQVLDDYGRKEISTRGPGDMRLLRDGVMMRGIWKNENGRTRFYDMGGNEINLKAGKIWIQIVPKEINIKIST